jgi:hypothetical protein
MILISRTYETWTPDDIEAGETNNQGFEFTDEPVTFPRARGHDRPRRILSPELLARDWLPFRVA